MYKDDDYKKRMEQKKEAVDKAIKKYRGWDDPIPVNNEMGNVNWIFNNYVGRVPIQQVFYNDYIIPEWDVKWHFNTHAKPIEPKEEKIYTIADMM